MSIANIRSNGGRVSDRAPCPYISSGDSVDGMTYIKGHPVYTGGPKDHACIQMLIHGECEVEHLGNFWLLQGPYPSSCTGPVTHAFGSHFLWLKNGKPYAFTCDDLCGISLEGARQVIAFADHNGLDVDFVPQADSAFGPHPTLTILYTKRTPT